MKRLTEAKADLESGIAKSLSQAPLDRSELEELKSIGIEQLIVDHGLDSVLAEIVRGHVKIESLRHANQDIMTPPVSLKESLRKSVRKSYARIIVERKLK